MRSVLSTLIVLLLTTTLLAQEASPTHAIGADFNGDGWGDVAAGSSNGRVFLLLGQEGNRLSKPQTYLLQGQVDELTVADFTGDGLDDLICSTGSRLALLSGEKNKGLSETHTLPTEFSQIISVTKGDFDGDKISDLAIACWGPDTLTVLRGRGDGTFLKPSVGQLPIKPFSVAAVDLDEDGQDEIAVSLVGNKKVILARFADGKLDLTDRLIFDGPIGFLTAGDFDGDGRVDLGAVGNNTFWILGRKRGELAPPISHSAGPKALLQFVDSGDLNGDGKEELFSTDLNIGRVVVPTGDQIDEGVFAWRASAFDLDGDGKAEIIVANVRLGTISVIQSALDRPVKTDYNVDPNRPD
jgi:VCBS repeat protein